MAKLNFLGGQVQLFDNNGNPLAGGKVYFYEPGTSTPKDTYTDSSLATANANPVVLDANGRASIWLNGNYKVVVKDSTDVTLYTEDNINPAEAASTGNYNFVTNGSFETNTTGDGKTPDGWTLTEYTGATVTLDTTDQQHGAQAIKFTSVGNGGGYIENTDLFEVSPNRDLDISFALKSSVVDVRNVVEIRWYDASQTYLSTTTLLDDSTTNPTSWTQKSYKATPPSSARYARLRMYGAHSSDATPGSTWYDDVVVKEHADTLPSGMLAPFAGNAAPDGWLLCDGSAVSRTTYADLFTAIGTTYGAGDGSTTFNLPDLRGRTAIGLDNMGGSSANVVTDANADSLGGTLGEENHTLTVNEIPAHTHSYLSTGSGSQANGGLGILGGQFSNTTGSTGGDQPHNNMQPSIALNWIIKT